MGMPATSVGIPQFGFLAPTTGQMQAGLGVALLVAGYLFYLNARARSAPRPPNFPLCVAGAGPPDVTCQMLGTRCRISDAALDAALDAAVIAAHDAVRLWVAARLRSCERLYQRARMAGWRQCALDSSSALVRVVPRCNRCSLGICWLEQRVPGLTCVRAPAPVGACRKLRRGQGRTTRRAEAG